MCLKTFIFSVFLYLLLRSLNQNHLYFFFGILCSILTFLHDSNFFKCMTRTFLNVAFPHRSKPNLEDFSYPRFFLDLYPRFISKINPGLPPTTRHKLEVNICDNLLLQQNKGLRPTTTSNQFEVS